MKAPDLSDLVQKSGARSVAIVGTAKNVGKTQTLNYLASELASRGLCVGLASSGRDGETIDALTGDPKPAVIPPEGSWVVTAEGALSQSGANLQIVDVSEKPGLLGRIVLGRITEPVPLELVGPQSARELSALVRKMLLLGADVVLVDGALDRVAAASPRVTDAVVLATGASAGDSLKDIADSVAFTVWLWSRKPPPDPEVVELARQGTHVGRVCFVDPAGGRDGSRTENLGISGTNGRFRLRVTDFSTCVGNEDQVAPLIQGASYAVIPGAVTEKFAALSGTWAKCSRFGIIARDPVSFFCKEKPGVELYALEPVRVLAVTVNPVAHRGISYESREMVRSVAWAIYRRTDRKVPVFDVVSGEYYETGVIPLAMG